MSETLVTYEGGLRCRAEHSISGAIVVTDAPNDHHGQGLGFSPSEMLAVSLGSCILTIMGIAAQSMNMEIAGASATISKSMSNAPRKISELAVKLEVPGEFDSRQRAKLEAAAHACPVHDVLGIDAPIEVCWVG